MEANIVRGISYPCIYHSNLALSTILELETQDLVILPEVEVNPEVRVARRLEERSESCKCVRMSK